MEKSGMENATPYKTRAISLHFPQAFPARI
jgi:hypothetical protein